MQTKEIRQQIEILMSEAVQRGIDCPKLNKRHETLAKLYSDGEKAYYDKQIDSLLAVNDSYMAHVWVNSGCPDMGSVEYVERVTQCYVDIYNNPKFDKQQFWDFVKTDLESFFIKYFAYIYLKAKSDNAAPRPQRVEVAQAMVPTQQPAHFNVSFAYMEAVFNFLSGETLPDSVSKQMFVDCVRSGNFRPIWETPGIKKAKLKKSIHIIGLKMPKEWYRQTAKSIGFEPRQCSAATVNYDWVEAFKNIK